MADVITRFKLETTQYDSKLREASKNLADYEKEASKAGKTFAGFSKEQVEAARSFGKVESGATSLKDKLKDLVGSYNTAAKAFNNLSDEQKNSDFGKALSESLKTLQGRITQTKTDFYDMSGSAKSTGGIMDQLAEKFTLNIDVIKLLNVGLTAAKTALNVAKDAFMANESSVDEWGRIVQSSQSLYEGFLNALNTGDISGYLSRIDSIVSAARTAYDELDRLGTMRTIQGPAISKQEAENNRLRMMIQTGRYIAPLDGTPTTIANGTQLNAAQIKFFEQKLEQGISSLIALSKNEITQTTKAIDAYYGSLAQQTGMSLKEFREGTSSMSAFDERVRGARAYNDWQMAHSYVDQQTGRLIQPRTGNPYAQYKGWDVFRVDKMGQNSFNDLVNLIKQGQQQISSAYSMQGMAYRTMNRAEGITVRQIMGGGSGDGGGKSGSGSTTTVNQPEIFPEGSLKSLTAEMQELQKAQQLVTSADEWRTYEYAIEGVKNQIKELKGELGLEALRGMKGVGISDSIKPLTREDIIKKGQASIKNFKLPEQKESPKMLDSMNTMASGMSQLVSGMQQIGITIPQEIQSVIGILQGITTILTAIQTINSIKFWAGGGVVHANSGLLVPGNHFSGDMVPSMINSGELILNKAQQGNLASQLQAASMINGGGGGGHDYVSGQNIYLGTNNYLKGSGQGQLVTTRMLRQYGLIN